MRGLDILNRFTPTSTKCAQRRDQKLPNQRAQHLLGLCTTLMSMQVWAQSSADLSSAIVDRVATSAMAEHSIPALTVAVSEHGKRRFFFYGDKPSGRRDDIVEIGSITKVFTAVLYAEALSSGQMRQDASIQVYLPGVPLQSCMQQVTPTMLIDFSSGLPLLPTDAPHNLGRRAIENYTVADFRHWAATVTIGTPERCDLPARYLYSNASVGLLGDMIATATGTAWTELLERRITGALGMLSTAISVKPQADQKVIEGHQADGDWAKPWPVFAWYAAGALRSTPEDMLRFGEAALGHSSIEGRTVPPALTAALRTTLAPIYQPHGKPFRQAMAWSIEDDGTGQGSTIAYKDGGTDGFNSVLVVDQARDLAVFVVGNRAKSGIPALGQTLTRELAASIAGQPQPGIVRSGSTSGADNLLLPNERH